MMPGIMVKMMAPLYMLWFETRGGATGEEKRKIWKSIADAKKKNNAENAF